MIRETFLKAKHDEISTCLTSRKRKLRELYSISFATVNIDAGDQPHSFEESLTSFLNANDLQEGRRFDLSSLELGKIKRTREDGKDKSTQAGPPLFQIDDRATEASSQSPTSSITRVDADKNKPSFAHGVSSKAAPDISQSPKVSAPLSPNRPPSTNSFIPPAATQPSKHGELPLPNQWAQKPGYNGPNSVHKENVASVTLLPSTRALLEDTPRDVEQRSASADNKEHRPQESLNLPIIGVEAASSQPTTTREGDSYPTLALAEGQTSQAPTVSLKPNKSLSTTAPLDSKTGRSMDASLNVAADPAHSFHAGPSTPEEQLRREEAQSLATFSPQTQPMSASRPASQINTSNELTNEKSHGPTSSLGPEVSMKPVNTDNSDHGKPQMPTDNPNRRTPGMIREVSKDLMLSQRPPIHIDTTVASQKQRDPNTETPGRAAKPNERTNVANGLSKPVTNAHPSPPERMTTRVSSGALRQKSVSEILGEIPRPSPHSNDKSPANIPIPESPGFRSRQSDLRDRERERSKLSTVVFAKQPQIGNHRGTEIDGQQASQDALNEPRDYLLSLFHYQASQSNSPSISALLGSSHKTLTTANHFTDLHEKQMYRITRRIYDMQNTHHWPLRQMERSVEPTRQGTHWDALLGHIKWLRTDFREERKWKLTAAKNLADWCAEWVVSSSERRRSLQIRSMIRSASLHKHALLEKGASTSHSEMNDDGLVPERTPDLVPSREDDSSDFVEVDTPITDVTRTGAAAAIFSLAPDDVVFGLKKTPVADRLLSELCLYRPWVDPEAPEAHSSIRTFDKDWMTTVLPVSKYAAGKLQFVNDRLPYKRGRYDYESEDEGGKTRSTRELLPLDQQDVALFDPDNKHIRDRIHAGHAFRPPSEYPMPSQGFFEARQSSQWTIFEDDELKRLVREYAYNWSLISSCLSSPSLFSSAAERRTPWECFERWVALEGLPADMAKTHYFRAYHARLDAAQRTINATNQALQQQHANNPQIPIRRRTSQPVRVERRRNNKHLVLVQAMTKLAKRRETAAQKQQHVASLAAMRKANETVQPRQRIQTPQEWSRFKFERECKRQEQQKQQLEQVKAAHAQKQMAQQQAGPSILHGGRNPAGVAAVANSSSPHLGTAVPNNQLPPGSQGQTPSLQSSQPLANSVTNSSQLINGQASLRGGHAPQAQMTYLPGQTQRVLAEAGRVQQEQQRYLQQQRLLNHISTNGQNGAPAPIVASNSLAHQTNAALMASMQANNGVPSPSSSVAQPAARSMVSPRPATSVPVQQPLSSGHMPMVTHFLNNLKATKPELSPEQQRQLANDQLERYRRSQNTLNAAAGHGVPNPNYQYPNGQRPQMNGGTPMLNPQMYAQMLRSQQSSQQHRNGVNGHNGNLRPSSRDSQQPPGQPRASIGSNGLGQSP